MMASGVDSMRAVYRGGILIFGCGACIGSIIRGSGELRQKLAASGGAKWMGRVFEGIKPHEVIGMESR